MSELLATTTDVAEQRKDSKTIFGFWVYIMTDCILFASLFATYAVLQNNTFGGQSLGELIDLPSILAETLILLTSSFTCGLAILAVRRGDKMGTIIWFGLTFALGLSFLVLELSEFARLVAEGNSWRRSGFLSSFFTLVSTHGLHITAGLLWMIVLLVRLAKQGFVSSSLRQFTLLSVFWHFLDIVWIFIFTIVYLMGAI